MIHNKYKIIEHTADLGVQILGKDMKELFVNAALVLMDLLVSFDSVDSSNELSLSLSAEDPSDLIVRWLGEILYLFHGEGLEVLTLLDF